MHLATKGHRKRHQDCPLPPVCHSLGHTQNAESFPTPQMPAVKVSQRKSLEAIMSSFTSSTESPTAHTLPGPVLWLGWPQGREQDVKEHSCWPKDVPVCV